MNSPPTQTKRPQTKAYGRFKVEAPGVAPQSFAVANLLALLAGGQTMT